MNTTYYALSALTAEWSPDLTGSVLIDAFSQVRDELTLAFAKGARAWMVRVSVRGGHHYLFRTEGYTKARRNVAALFEEAVGRTVVGLRMAERDRMIFFDLADGDTLQVVLFGPRANVFLVGNEGHVREAFQYGATCEGAPAPMPRPAPRVDTFATFAERWRTNRKTTAQAVASAYPLFDRTLAREVVSRAGVTEDVPRACTQADLRRLFEAARVIAAELHAPQPRIYWRGRIAGTFSLIPLQHLAELSEERFETVDRAVSVFVRRMLGQEHFRRLYDPLEKALSEAAGHYGRSAGRMLAALATESRADRYERWGHLLMATPGQVPAGAEEVTLPDLFGEGEALTVPLDPSRSAVDNAQAYYERARRTRRAREEAERRLDETAERARTAEALLAALRDIDTLAALKAFREEEAERLAPFLPSQAGTDQRLPFRRYALPGGYEVWVGRNAKQNDLLTFRYAQKYDLWMHARGVAGSHAVLRLPGRHAQPDRRTKERAAAIAAYHSKARGSSLVPVMITERKYVRKPRGAAPGAVVAEREDVIMVEPHLPA